MGFWGPAIGVASSLLGGALGASDGRKAQRQQMAFINQARDLYGEGRNALEMTHQGALESVDEANMVLAGIEPAILAGMDEQLRVAFANQLMQQEQDQAALQSRMASAGMDASTAMAGVQRGQRFGQAQALGNVGAAFAGQRASAIAGARQGVAGGLMNRASMISGYGQSMANMYSQEAGLLGGIQVQPANTGAGIGAIGGQISNALFQNELIGLLNDGDK